MKGRDVLAFFARLRGERNAVRSVQLAERLGLDPSRRVAQLSTGMRQKLALAVTLAYPYAKRFVSVPQAVLGIAFSFGIPMAFAAVQAEVPALAWWLLAGNLFWVLAYDTEYAMVDRDDDLKIGIRTSAITLGRFDVAGVMAFYAIYLLSWLYLGLKLGLGPLYAVGIVVAGLQAAWHSTLIYGRTRDGCFRAFRANHWVGAAVFVGVVLSYQKVWSLH